MDDKITKQYRLWLDHAEMDEDIVKELEAMTRDKAWIEDAFYRSLAFGTGGLRGIIGAGTNRMNIYTVAQASQGLADYIIRHFTPEERSIAVAYDSRIKSELFAKTASGVFAANGIQVYLYDRLMPTPCLSFAVRRLECAAGVMVTASHNPAEYNGYKVYGADGCQITAEAAGEIQKDIEKLDLFRDVVSMDFHAGMEMRRISYIHENILDSFIEEVKRQSCLYGAEIEKNISIVYSPLNGTGLEPVLRILKESGYTNLTVVKEQEQPDGSFPTCPYPNPEIKEAMALGMQYAKSCDADLLLATDPDCDRIGLAVKNADGKYDLLSGNETGMLLLDYICMRRIAAGTMPKDPVMVKTIVTADIGEKIASRYGVRTVNVLTGFKYIGEQIGRLEAAGKGNSYIFGFEESCGYLSGSYVRDKDAVGASLLICEMAAWYLAQGIRLTDKLNELYATYGYCLNTLHSYVFEGNAGLLKMRAVMQKLRSGITDFGGRKVTAVLDYAEGISGMQKSDVLKFILEDGCSVIIRPSGTEPKLKVYISVRAEKREETVFWEEEIISGFEKIQE